MTATVEKRFIATCPDCGWTGTAKADKRDAEDQADGHHCGSGAGLLDEDDDYAPDEPFDSDDD